MVKLKSELKYFSENNHQVYKYQEYIGILKNAFQKSPELFNEIDKVIERILKLQEEFESKMKQ